ncbi:radical s-adenosyl methionine domain-containing protein 2 [Stemphylium lycopersici]|uniref:Radical s-adenosyl methionine domain-containing protein 2 n=1 Tax=Stemphylium lycopersici TaxID=183478 RepID=A0A364N0D7_STELY|nr:radical s-adenosyl methionine domain-containing protein 2 [Stemphylium lycopersici]RAR01265.1 radical s-adenosyl methionine domain-containing protein 2 [Stemphylium lycopersici]RAR08700.1 radical s-adenosyl methionine domain-containing protein 2 [Stemphylium lycopersici]
MVLLSLFAEFPAFCCLVIIALGAAGAAGAYVALYKRAVPNPNKVTTLRYETARKSDEKPIGNRNEAPAEPLDPTKPPEAPVSVNYFPSRLCNYACKFCFHTATSSFKLELPEAARGLKLLKDAGMRKLNIAGGEPFLHPEFLSSMLQYCKEVLEIESISIVSNGSLITGEWIEANAKWLDILAISCDSFDAETNINIGRGGDGKNVERLHKISNWCKMYDIKFKLNTVVNIYNWNEDMAAEVEKLAPFRWKVFQCLIVEGENENAKRKRDARELLVSDAQWRSFCDRHKHLPCYVPEDNNSMASSYLLLDEYMQFLDKGQGMMKKSQSILKVGVENAMKQIVWDKKSFVERGGIYDWGRSDMKPTKCGTKLNLKALEY